MFYRVFLIAIAAIAAGCSDSKNSVALQKYAVLRFENLTSDAANDWVGRAASEVLIQELSAIPSSVVYKAGSPFSARSLKAPGVSTEITDARLAGATRLITGYYEVLGGKLTITAMEEDAATGKTVRVTAAQGSVLGTLQTIAKQFSPSPKAFGTTNETALRAFILGDESADASPQYYEQAIAADPSFGQPYLAWSEYALAEGNRSTLQHILSEAREHKLPSSYIAKLELADATLAKDPDMRQKALLQLVNADPYDPAAIKAMADSEMVSHRFQSAATYYAKIAGPTSPDLLNLLAYARMFGDDEKGALNAIKDYQKAVPQDPNAIDSQGDVELYFGHLGDAEKTYLRAAAKDPNFNQGADLWKAARAHLMTGDIPGASQIFARFRQQREAAKDPLVPLRVADWRYSTGDRASAVDDMHKAAEVSANPALKAFALTQASIWELQMSRRNDATRDSEMVIKAGQSSSIAAAAIVRFCIFDPASPNELTARAERSFHGPGSEQLGRAAVAYALWFSKRYADAAPVWKQINDRSNPNDQSPRFMYAGALKESGGDASALLKPNPIPTLTTVPSFESLYFPKLYDWRGDHATYVSLSGSTAASAK